MLLEKLLVSETGFRIAQKDLWTSVYHTVDGLCGNSIRSRYFSTLQEVYGLTQLLLRKQGSLARLLYVKIHLFLHNAIHFFCFQIRTDRFDTYLLGDDLEAPISKEGDKLKFIALFNSFLAGLHSSFSAHAKFGSRLLVPVTQHFYWRYLRRSAAIL